jgi:hypothetical protein
VRRGSSASFAGLLVAIAVAACGARTELSIEIVPEAGSDAEHVADARSDASGPPDAPFDVTPDVVPDVPVDSLLEEAGDGCVGPCPCLPGTLAVGSSCLPIVGSIPAPRPLAPMSTARVTTGTPVLTWELPRGDDGAVVECCADRLCSQLTETFLAPGTGGSPSTPLPAGVSFWRLLGTSNGSVGSTASPTWELTVPFKASTNVKTWWGTMLDVNGDGLADLGVTAVINDDYVGSAYIYLSTRGNGPASTPLELDGPERGGEYGCTIDSAGDLNGDGFGDLVVGQCDVDQAPGAGSAAYVFFGGPSGISATAPTVLPEPVQGIAFGYAAGSAGDVNADGYGDLVVGSATGVSYLYLGGPSGIGTVPTPLACAGGNESGTAIRSADVNGDGWGDLVLGGYQANGFDGNACVYLGTAAGLSSTPVALPGPAAGSGAAFGSAIGVGDLNADGYADVLVGAAFFGGQTGEAYLFMGGPGGLDAPPVILGNPNGSNAGRFTIGLSGVHDINGDGFDDFVVGSYLSAGNVGAAWLYLGSATELSMPIPLPDPYGVIAYFGNAVAGADMDGDGYADVVVGAEGVGGYAGAASWYRGSAGGLLSPMTVPNPHSTTGAFGWSVGL